MTFQFAYEHILSLKEKEKEQAFSEYGRLVKQKDQLQADIYLLEQEHDQRNERSQCLTSLLEIQQQSQYMNLLIQKIDGAREKLEKMEDELRNRQEKYMQKHKDERMWTFLREKAYDTFLQKEKKIEQEQLDEIATIRHFHQRIKESPQT